MNSFSTFLALVGMASPLAAFMVPKLSPTPTALKVMEQGKPDPIPDDYVIPGGYVGGFADSKSEYAYPVLEPDLSDLPIMDNMDNIDKLERYQSVIWPEFSWLTDPSNENSRVYQRFADNVSRLGYSNDGRVYSIICPQQGMYMPHIGTVNIEVTVTGVRGWCKEPEKTFYADMQVEAKIWFTEERKAPTLLKALAAIADHKEFPFSKEHAIVVETHNRNEPWNPVFRVKNGTTTEYPIPPDRLHWKDNAYGVGHLYVEIGDYKPKTDNEKFNELAKTLIGLINTCLGNKLLSGNTLSWNLWMAPPKVVDQDEWKDHAEKWRDSIDVLHEYPGEKGNIHDYVKDYYGNSYKLDDAISDKIAIELHKYIHKWKTNKVDKFNDGFKEALENMSHIHFFHHKRK